MYFNKKFSVDVQKVFILYYVLTQKYFALVAQSLYGLYAPHLPENID